MCLFVCLFVRAIGVARPRGRGGEGGGMDRFLGPSTSKHTALSSTQRLQALSAFSGPAPPSGARRLQACIAVKHSALSRAQRFQACGALRHAGPTSTRHLRGPGALKHASLEPRTASKHSVLPWLPVVYAFINRNHSSPSFNLSTRFLRYAVSVQDLYEK